MALIELNFTQTIKAKLPSYKRFVEDILSKLREIKALPKSQPVFVSISFIGKQQMQRLSRDYRGKDKVTDVLTFGDIKNLQPGEPITTDIYICYDVAKVMAKQYSHSVNHEIKVLLVHAILHFVGYDHKQPIDRIKMHKMEQKLLTSTGLTGR